jgi:hypothetical protein
MAIGYFLSQPTLRVAIVVRYKQNMLKTSINYFKMSKIYGSRHFKIIYRYFKHILYISHHYCNT